MNELQNAITQLSQVVVELNTDQGEIDALNTQLANETASDKKEAVLDYLRAKGRAIHKGAIVISDETQNFNTVDGLEIANSQELALVFYGFTKAGHVYVFLAE
jgi:hypothetical protein